MRSLWPWRRASRTVRPGTAAASAASGVVGGGRLSHCRVTARRSFIPAQPTSRARTPSAVASAAAAAGVVSSRFSIQTKTWSPAPLGG